MVFNDVDGNGAQGDGEDGIPGATVTLDGTRATTTDGNGDYIFTNVLEGTHTVSLSLVPGFTNTTNDSVCVSLAEGGSVAVNFGVQPTGAVSGRIINYANGAPIAGAVVTMFSSPVETTTDAFGLYSFADVEPGSHTVELTPPEGFVGIVPNVAFVSVAQDGAATANFAQLPIGSVSGRVFNDVDGDGAQNVDDEHGIGGVAIQLKDSGGNLVGTEATAGDGTYVFTGAAAGSYIVEETDPEGFASTTSNEVAASVATDGAATANFGDQQANTVSGRVFNDTNGDGIQGAGENGMQGVLITLASPAVETTTDFFGAYSFAGVAPGAYTVKVTPPWGFVSTTSNEVSISVAADGVAAVSFGQQPAGTVSGRVFKDTNGDGVLDPGETGIGGVTVDLRDGAGSLVDTVATVGDGTYVFTEVAAGSYTVEETDPEGFASTTPNEVAISLAADGVATASFGDQPAGTVSGRVFVDTDGNGVQDRREGGIGGVNIRLIDSAHNLVARKSTAGDGTYVFTGVEVGSYSVVKEADPEGFVSTTSNVAHIVISPDGAATANFGDQQIGAVSGRVFNDADGDGAQDADEDGIGGVTIWLRDSGGSLVDTAATAGDGTYVFTGVAAGSYTVEETDPEGFVSTTPNVVAIVVTPGGAATANFGDGVVSRTYLPLIMKND